CQLGRLSARTRFGHAESTNMATNRPKGPLTENQGKALEPPANGNRIVYDGGKDAVRGFGIRITAAGARAFVLNYRAGMRERRITIGGFPDWSVKAAREQGRSLRRQIDSGSDPMAERHEGRSAPTMDDLAD